MAEGKEAKENNNSEKIEDITSKLRSNPWIVSTIALGLFALVLLFFVVKPGLTGNVISENAIGAKAVDFINTQLLQGQGTVTLDSVSSKNGLYEVIVDYNGQQIPTYFTKDGKSYVSGSNGLAYLVPLTADTSDTQTPAEIPKSDKPKAELYIFSYCPAGTAALDAFAKAGEVLSSVADLKVKFFSNMHGEHEKQQNMIQECIQDIAKDKYWDYASQYVAKIYDVCGATGDIGCDKNESIKLMKLVGINSDSVMACVAQKGERLYAQDQSDADEFGLGASPSLVVNGVSLGSNFDRSSEGIKAIVCDSFNTAPSVCNQQLETTASTSSGSCG